jgi:hypothetical protein
MLFILEGASLTRGRHSPSAINTMCEQLSSR